MAAYEILLLNTAIPQIQAAQAGDTYVVPRDIAINATAIISANSATDALRITQTGAGNALVVEDSANPDATPFVVTAAGDVGIGTNSLSSKLDVFGANRTNTNEFGTITAYSSDAYAIDKGGSIAFWGRYNAAGGSAAFGRIYGAKQDATDGSFLGYLGFSTSPGGAPVERMRLDSSGNLGLGTDSPVSAFGLGQTASGTGITFQSTSTTFNSGKAAVIKASIPGSGNGVLIFETYEGGSGGGERARISSDGTFRVKGAGTAGSTDAVQFSGSAPAQSLILDSNGKLSVDVGGTTGTTYNIIGLNGGGAIANGAITTQSTTNVANTATTILTVTNTGNMVMVTGQGSGAIFMDLLLCGYTSNTVTVITSATQQGSPAARTYTLSSGALQLQMGSATAMTVKAVNIFAGA